mgnify:CR=1 FL=1
MKPRQPSSLGTVPIPTDLRPKDERKVPLAYCLLLVDQYFVFRQPFFS